jgi:predicted RNA-binding protein with PIN domain
VTPRREADILVIDAMNVIGSRPTGWWRNRDGAVRSLARRLGALARSEGFSIVLVVDGYPVRGLPEGAHDGVEVVYARRGGRNAADDRIIEYLEQQPDPARIVVVTSDRLLAERASALGARVRGASWLLARLDELGA